MTVSVFSSVFSHRYTTRNKLWVYLLLISFLGILAYFTLFFETIFVQSNKKFNDYSHHITIVLNTYKRHELMKQAIEYYSQCNLIKHIYVVWSEDKPPPADLLQDYDKRISPKARSSVFRLIKLNLII